MQAKSVIVDGKKRIIINRTASGEEKVKEAMLVVMGPGWEFDEEKLKTPQDEVRQTKGT